MRTMSSSRSESGRAGLGASSVEEKSAATGTLFGYMFELVARKGTRAW